MRLHVRTLAIADTRRPRNDWVGLVTRCLSILENFEGTVPEVTALVSACRPKC
jgi:hypothetical protein